VGAFLLSLGARLFEPHPESVWSDEANSVLMATRPLAGVIDALTHDGNPPLYYVVLHFWAKLFGEGEVALRSLSAILGSLLAPGLYLFARKRFGRAAAIVAALLAVLWPLHVYYSQQIRMYSLLPVLALAFVAALLRALDRGDGSTWRDWAWVVVSAIAVVWTHNYGMFLVAAAPVAWLVRGPRTKRTAARLALALVAIGVVDLLWLPVVLRQASSGVGSSWIPQFFEGSGAIVHSLLLFGGGATHPMYLQALGDPPGHAATTAPLAAAWLIGVGVCVSFALARWREKRLEGLALIVLALGPLAIPWAASLASTPIYLVGRYDMVGYAGFALLVGFAAECLWRESRLGRGVVLATAVLYAVLAAMTLVRYWSVVVPRADERIAQAVTARAHDGDAVITTGLSRAPFEYYARRLGWGGRLRIESYPRVVADHLGWIDRFELPDDEWMREANDLATSLAGFSGRVFLLAHGSWAALLVPLLDAHAVSQHLVIDGTTRVIEYRLSR
jgi:4-amino-4-deoxy-L-arabinose transferase-like glycosyltransferase